MTNFQGRRAKNGGRRLSSFVIALPEFLYCQRTSRFTVGQHKTDRHMEIKIFCNCGAKYKFDVEPVNGQMPRAVVCPVCGVDGTAQANQIIRQQITAPVAEPLGVPAQRTPPPAVPQAIRLPSTPVAAPAAPAPPPPPPAVRAAVVPTAAAPPQLPQPATAAPAIRIAPAPGAPSPAPIPPPPVVRSQSAASGASPPPPPPAVRAAASRSGSWMPAMPPVASSSKHPSTIMFDPPPVASRSGGSHPVPPPPRPQA